MTVSGCERNGSDTPHSDSAVVRDGDEHGWVGWVAHLGLGLWSLGCTANVRHGVRKA